MNEYEIASLREAALEVIDIEPYYSHEMDEFRRNIITDKLAELLPEEVRVAARILLKHSFEAGRQEGHEEGYRQANDECAGY